uniref:Synaptobrevin, longin-like domain protein n=1 Tax=Tanacetum cinerariifolium TaxID=118510 RepID=A0A6L2LWH4_TANCI|nr:synaptobrevin, longin-like domain protein [Tanacetum cinerariifolium]
MPNIKRCSLKEYDSEETESDDSFVADIEFALPAKNDNVVDDSVVSSYNNNVGDNAWLNAAGGFEQIIDFLSGSYIHHALTVNPHVYISCIKQFWNTAVVKRSGDVTRLQALVDKKRIVISEEFFIRTILHSLSAKQTSWNEFSSAMASALICLSSRQRFNFSKYNFESLVRNVDSSSKFYMYPRVGKGFLGVETPLFENMLAVRAVDAEEEVQVPAQDDDVQEHAKVEVATDVVSPTPTSPSPSSPVIPSLLPHQSPSPPQPQAAEGSSHLVQQIIKLKARVKKLERLNKVKSSKLRRLKTVGNSQRIESLDEVENVFNQGRMSVDMETDKGVELVVDQEKDHEVEGRHADTQAEIYNIDLDHSSKVLSMQEDTEVQEAVEVVTTAKLITEVVTTAATQVAAASTPILAAKPKTLKIVATALAVSTRRRKGVVIRDPEEELHTDTPAETPTVKDKGKGILIEDPKPIKKKDQVKMDAEYAKKLPEELNKEHEEAYKQIDWNATFDHVQAKETQYIKRYHGFKKKPQSESEAHKNMISYLKNTEGYKMEFFKGKTYDQILPIFKPGLMLI